MGSRTTKKLLSSDKLILDGKSLRFFSTQRTGGTSVAVAETTASVVTTNLVVHLDASNSSSYGGSGTTWTDLTGGNNVTLVNGPTFNNGYDGSIVFDGTDDYAQSGTSSDLIIGTQDYTMSLWVKYDSAKSEICLMDNRTAHGNGTTFSLVQVGDAMRIKVWEDNTSSYSFESSTNLSANTWYNITYTRISNSASMYINGVQDGSSWTQTYNYSGGNQLTLGWNYSRQTGKSMDGYIPHVLFYVNKGLTSSEVTQNYNAIKSRYQEIITTNLVFHLDAANAASYGGSGTTWSDLSTNSNNATLTGPTFNSNNGGYFDFDGSNDHAISASDMFDPNSNFTFSAWVNSDSTITGTMVSDYSNFGALQIRFVNDGTVQIVDSYTTNVGTFSNFTYSTGTWYNVVVTRSSNTYSLYINGVYKSDFTSTNSYSYGPQSIGANYTGVERWNGKISQIACYNTALSATQVEENFDALKNRYGL